MDVAELTYLFQRKQPNSSHIAFIIIVLPFLFAFIFIIKNKNFVNKDNA